MFEKILVPLDGGKLATQAIPYALRLVEKFHSNIILFSACESSDEEQVEFCRRFLEEQASVLRQSLPEGSIIQQIVVSGQAASKIIECANQYQASLIIMTTHGSSGLGPWPMGGTARKVFHSGVSTPLLLVKSQEKDVVEKELYKELLIPLDGSPAGEAAIPYVIALAEKFNSKVTLLHVIEEGRHVHTIGGLQYVPFLDQDITSARKNARTYLDEVATRFPAGKVEIFQEIVVGDVSREILKVAEKKPGCLIALASHGHSGVGAWMFGSVTYKITQAVNQPFLVVRSH